uniref:GIY-YIG intron encoded protein n=1 Tax=Orbilia brochopaga TaxID=3140254 RepID=A0A481ZLZ7_9PEZI|nr:GIY-YIG intron encoded protein [Drechslerella brochopaga]QBL02543.1 GIY-YIG intron encoded protein [Drechslerella brochopaga]
MGKHKISNKTYVGSAIDLNKRFKDYLSPSYLAKELLKHNNIIYKALLKYGYDKFDLEILEYCDKNSILKREQYYIDKIKPLYNICTVAGSSLGRITTLETREKLKAAWVIKKLNQVGVKQVEVTDINTGNVEVYQSIRQTAIALKTNHTTVRKYINNQQLYLNRYKFKVIV